jgi:hypothetical protein
MDINNIQALIAQGLLTDVASVDPNKAYVAVGVFQPGNRQSGPAGNAYPSYAMPISEFLATGGIYTASNGIALVGNDFQLASLNISQFTNDANYVAGTGTIGYIPRWNLTDTLGNSVIFDDGLGKVGINEASPIATLDVNGSMRVYSGGARIGNVGVGSYSFWSSLVNEITTLFSGTSDHLILQYTGGGNVGVGTNAPTSTIHAKGLDSTSSNYALKVDNSASSPLLYVNNNGNVGIGIAPTLADVKLEVKVATNQRFIFRNFTYPSIGAALTLQAINDATTDVVNVVTLGLDWYHASRNNLFSNPTNTIIPTAKVHIIGNNQGSDLFALKVDNVVLSPLLYVRNDGNVGMGTILPTAKLDVRGQIIAGPTGNITSNDSPFYSVRTNLGSPNYYTGMQYAFEVGGGIWGIGFNYANDQYQFLSGSTAEFIFGSGNPTTPNGKFIMDMSSGYFGANIVLPTATIHGKALDSTSGNYTLQLDNLTSPLLYVRNDGLISAPLLQTGNAGLSTGDIYVDTAANILANGDKVVGWKV